MEKDEMDIENPSYTLKESSETLLPIQLFEFKAQLLEAVEELRMGRIAKIQYEEQIKKILMEKQELTWKYESLSKEEENVEKKHSDSLVGLKKQMQAKICLIEEEKGRFQLAAETKERENISLREDIKALQISKYSYQKKVHEMEQKLQLHILAKEDHIKQLSECKKCIGNVTQQFGMIKEVHEKLEQTVQTAIQNNKKLNIEINQKKNEIERLKEELEKLSSDFLKYKVTYQQRADEENVSFSEKEQHVKELKERLQTETEINKNLMEVNTCMKEGKQEDIRALNNMRILVQRHTQTIISLENQLFALKEDYKTLERDNELQRAKATENEEKFLALQREHKQAFSEWKVQKENLKNECDRVRKDLESIKELHNNLQNRNSESLNKTPEPVIQPEGQQSSMDSAMCDTENNTTENRTKNDPAANTTTSYVGGLSDVSLSVTSNEIQKMDGSKVEIVHKDTNSLQDVYNMTDKGNVSEEQKDESALTENKASASAAESNVKESWEGKCTEESPVDKTCLNDVDQDEERVAERRTIQTQAMTDNYKPPTVCREDASQQTDSSHRKSRGGTSEEVYIVNDKPDRTDNDRGVLINEACPKESQLLDQTVERLINEQGTTRDISAKGNSPSPALRDGSNYRLPDFNRDTSEISTMSYIHDADEQSKAEPMQPTSENLNGVRADSLFSEHNDPKSVESKESAKHSVDMVTPFRPCLGQETNLVTSYTFPGLVGKSCSRSTLALKKEDCNLQSLQYTENLNVKDFNTDVRENCPLDTRKDPSVEETIECDVNVKRSEQSDQISDPAYVDEEKVCIQEIDNMAAGCMSPEVSSKLADGESCTPMSKPNENSPIHLSNLPKFVYLPGSNLRDSLNISLSNQTNPIPPKLSGQDVNPSTEHVPRKDHSAEWNAEQAFCNSLSPILATSSENSDVVEKPNLCPAVTDGTDPNTAHMEVTGSNKDNSDISSIQRQISAIERFLLNNKLNGPRKRKLEDTCLTEE